jgi:type II secretory pathway component GspD/PulD (secretin)
VEFLNGQLVMIGSDEDCTQAKEILAKLDFPSPQVMIEAKAVELSRDEIKNLGVGWIYYCATRYIAY